MTSKHKNMRKHTLSRQQTTSPESGKACT